jgi:hypothetical protein
MWATIRDWLGVLISTAITTVLMWSLLIYELTKREEDK